MIKPVDTDGKRLLLFYSRLADTGYGIGQFKNADDYSMVKSYSRWKKTWQDIIPMDVDGDGNDELVFYDFKNSLFEVCRINGNAECKTLGTWSNAYLGGLFFRQIMPVQMDEDASSELSLYSDDGILYILNYRDSISGFTIAQMYGAPSTFHFIRKITYQDNSSGFFIFDAHNASLYLLGGDFSFKLRQNWYPGWTDVVTGDFGSGKEFGDVFFYDRIHGEASYYSVNTNGLLLKNHIAGYRKTWSIIASVHSDPASASGCSDRLLFYEKLNNAELAIPSYDGQNQSTHPDVVSIGSNLFTMVCTPYPFQNDAFENPSVLKSNDGFSFGVVTNDKSDTVGFPLCQRTNPFSIWNHTWNNDPDILFENNTYYIVYQETYHSTSHDFRFENIVLIEADTAFKSISFTRILSGIKFNGVFPISPTLIKVGARYYLFFVNCDTDQIRYLSTNDIYSWPDISSSAVINLGKNGTTFHPWHLDVVSDGDTAFYLLISGHFDPAGIRYANNDLYVAKSKDMAIWSLSKMPLINRFDWGCNGIYRASGSMVSSSKMTVWFAFNKSFENGIAIRKNIDLSTIFH